MKEDSTTGPIGPQYGLEISKAEADTMFKKARDIEVANEGLLKTSLGADPEADVYYTDPTCGFIFSRSQLQLLLDKMTTDDHHLVLFRGAKDFGSGTLNQGRKTLIAMVYMADTPTTMQLNTMEFASATKIGIQHPGTVRAVANYSQIPSTINTSDITP